MRGDRMERFVLLPFAVGCMSESSVGVASSPQSQRSSPPSLHPTKEEEEEILSDDDDECSSKSRKPNLSSIGIDRLFKGFKTLSHLFVYKEEEEEEMEIEIGVPTDVKHVTHIGWDGVVQLNRDTLCSLDHNCLFLNNNLCSAAAASIPQIHGQDHTADQITPINPADHHRLIRSHDQVYKQIIGSGGP